MTQYMMDEIRTSCRDCIFAEYVGDTQTGCGLGRIEKFERNGARVVGVDDGFRRFLVISGRSCTARRSRDWAEGKPAGDLMRLAREEFAGHCTMLIYVGAGSSNSDLRASLESVAAQGPRPRGAVILFDRGHPDSSAFKVTAGAMGLPFDYHFRRIEPPDAIQSGLYGGDPYRRAVDIGLEGCETSFYSTARAGYRWHPDYLGRIDHALNDELIRFVSLRPDADGNGLFMQTGLHNSVVNGNRGKHILEKVEEIAASEETTSHLIKDWDELPAIGAGGVRIACDDDSSGIPGR